MNFPEYNKDKSERDILNKMHKDLFHKLVKKYNIKLENIFTKSLLCIQDYHIFNSFVRNLNEKYNLDVYETVMFMEDYYVKFKKIVSMLDDENMYKIKEEMSKKYCIKIEKSKLNEFLEFQNVKVK